MRSFEHHGWHNWLLLAGLCMLSTFGLAAAVLSLLHQRAAASWPWEHTDLVLIVGFSVLVVVMVSSLTRQQRRLLQVVSRHEALRREVEQKERAQEELAALTEDLERQVAGRTVALQEQATRMLKLYHMAYDFVGNVSHEFRTPVTVIKEYVSALEEALTDTDLDPDVRRFFEIIRGRVDDLELMVDDLIDVTRLESNIIRVSRRVCRFGEIVQRILDTVTPKARKYAVTLEFVPDQDLPDLYCDPEKIGRVLINLVMNALKFSPQGGVVRVWALHETEEAQVRIGVTDQGPGIPRENRQIIFERFKQFGQQAKTSTKGFGLGLHIAKELVRLNFGDFQLHSSLGIGSIFSFTVPTWNPSTLLPHYLRHVGYFRQASALVSLLEASAPDATGKESCDDLDSFLEERLRRTDLLFRTSHDVWLIVVATGAERGLVDLTERLQLEHEQINRVRPLEPLPSVRFHALGTWSATAEKTALEKAFLAALRHGFPAQLSSRLAPVAASSGSMDTCT